MKSYWGIVALQVVKGMLVYSVVAWEGFEILKVSGQILSTHLQHEMWIYRRTSWVLPCREHDCFESKIFPHLSMFPFIHILSGKYLTSILTIPRPAIRHRTLKKGEFVYLNLSSINAAPNCAILRVLCQLEDMESDVDKA